MFKKTVVFSLAVVWLLVGVYYDGLRRTERREYFPKRQCSDFPEDRHYHG